VTGGRPGLVVATWNIRAGIGPGEPFPPAWWRHVRPDRLSGIASFIGQLDADVVALEEVAVLDVDGELIDMPGELAKRTGYDVRYAAVGHFPIVDPESGRTVGASLWGNAILSRLPISASAGLGLPMAADDDLVEPVGGLDPLIGGPHRLAGVRYADAPTGSREPRSLVQATIESAFGPVHLVATHLTHVGGGQRRQQAAAVAEVVSALDGPVVVTGDLNAPVDAPALEPLAGTLTDAFAATGTPVGDPARRSCGPFPLDHVLVRDLRPIACAVDRAAGDLSDHWPVRAVLEPAET
jgi:endonuclease/exonuclease/phosphatase family metal-dependent hydrolase